MSQVMEHGTDVAAVVDEYDAIRRTVQLCLDGEAEGDVDKLRAAFHPDARMFGSLAGVDYLSLTKVGGEWKIVSKLFAHTGGEPPELG
jgi:Putative lumazine-binding